MKYLSNMFFAISIMLFSSAVFSQGIETSRSLTESSFWSRYGQAAGLYIGFHNGTIRACPSLSAFQFRPNFCDNVGNSATNQLRITWDVRLQRAYFAYKSTGNDVMSGWADSGFRRGLAQRVLQAKTDETPVISLRPGTGFLNNDFLVIAYEGNRSDKLFYASNPAPGSSFTWENNREAGGGSTRFGPDALCAIQNTDQFILQYRGRRNTRRCYQTTYDQSQNNWGRETSCIAL